MKVSILIIPKQQQYVQTYPPPVNAKTIAITGFVASVLTTANPANAISFNFFYTSNDPNVKTQTLNLSPNNTLLTASGVMDINKNAGEAFTNADISNVNINVTDGTNSFKFTAWINAGGVIAVDGKSASFNAAGNPFTQVNSFESFFGCDAVACSDGNDPDQFLIAFNNFATTYDLDYNNQANALAAFQITAPSAVPFEFNPALGLVGFGAVFGVKKFMTKKAVKK
ncbi:hypothetical protein Syn7502_01943 [Synechococcus sp. PCC 7502]|uniref:PFE-CTERM domain-containing protein n=1 Tax=Synechococcus sp. PCC 7502 TaxID=1173263 RepID=UPI00029FC94B|nr:hypothetical protein [Synechococcus sp. PCC 7502]AFY73974.1 hypothetical protein Syn7502_01943 [Synechococcus sp. PCC 7502]